MCHIIFANEFSIMRMIPYFAGVFASISPPSTDEDIGYVLNITCSSIH
jgi:hypothetical protein